MALTLFFSFFSILVIVCGLYLARKFSRAFPPKSKFRPWGLILLWGFLALPLGNFLLRKTSFYAHSLNWATFISVGFFSIVMVLYLTTDLVILVKKLWGKWEARKKSTPKSAETHPERREFFTQSFQAGVLVASAGLTTVGHHLAYSTPQVKKVEVALDHLPQAFKGLRILQLSDLHVGPLIRQDYVEKVVEECLKHPVDLIALTGDFVDGSVADLREHIAPLAKLTATHGVYFVTGNHEYYSGVEPWIEEMQRLGARVLNNEHVVLKRGADQLVIAGVTDIRGGRFGAKHVSDPKKSLQGAPMSVPKILLAHQPRSIYEAAALGFDLQLSGHTHAGQYFPFTVLVHFFQPYVRGLNRHDKTWIYVNQGTGFWGPPNRLGALAEITHLTLV